ncbi:DUF4097 family beta strand repeat protein [Alteromonas sp. SM 2104]|nr:DUF4097 family beta strand repeat protein [Alteromonas oceanisediminis]
MNAFAGQKIDQSMDVDKTSYIDIEHMNGSAVIKGWDKSEVHVSGELSEHAEEFIFRRDGNRVRIEVEMKGGRHRSNGWGWNNDDGDDLVIYVPHESHISYSSVNASIDAQALYADVDIDVVNGAISVDDVRGRVRLESVNGDVKAMQATGDLHIETVNGAIQGEHSGAGELGFESVNGDIDMRSDSQEISAETVNGDLYLTLGNVDELDLTTVNGSIDVKMHLNEDGEVRIATVGGSVELTFQKAVSARFDIKGHAGGNFVNRLTDDTTQKAKYGPRRWLEFTTGSGSAKVDVSTVNGRVKLQSK